jgi:hypothetical protein
MQEHEEVLKTNIRQWVRGWWVRWFPCLRMGKEQGNSIGVLDAMRAGGVRKKEGKKNAVKLWGGYGRGVPVEDCIAMTGSMVRMGCDGEGGRCKKGRVWGAMKEG